MDTIFNLISKTNKELAYQLSTLSRIARRKKIPILVTNQVYSDFKTGDISMVGGDLLKYWSKCIIKLEKLDSSYKATIVKHRSLANKSVYFDIKERGLVAKEEPKKGFRLF